MIELLRHAYGWFDAAKPLAPTAWPHFDLLFIHSGSLRLRIHRRWISLDSPQAVLIYPRTAFEGVVQAGACRASIQHFKLGARDDRLPAPFAQLLRRQRGIDLFPRDLCQTAEADVHRAIALSECRVTRATLDVRVALMCVILGTLQGRALPIVRPSERQSFVVKVEGWLRQRLHDPISVHAMAEEFGQSFGAFRAAFRKQAGVSPARFLRDLRMRETQRLLIETDLPVKQIARMVGYPELPHLYRTFRAHAGTVPAKYRSAAARFG